jgi:steroid delta-isomerase-like uncharacterized protein
MKKLLLVSLALILFISCEQEQRYFAESAETKALGAGIAAYESGAWDQWRSHFADTAQIFVNSSKSISLDERLNDLKANISNLSSYGFDKEGSYIEMVLDKDKETWVYFWAEHSMTLAANNKKLVFPVHLAVRFESGKIIEEHVYYDGTEMNNEMVALANMSDMENTIMGNTNSLAQAWITNDMDAFNNLTVENLGRSVNGIEVVKNQKEYRDMIQSNHDMLSDINIETSDMMIVGNKAYFKWTFSGKNTKDTASMPATNKAVSTNGMAIWTFDNDGKATYEEVYFDQNDINMQLGFTLTAPTK